MTEIKSEFQITKFIYEVIKNVITLKGNLVYSYKHNKHKIYKI